MKRFLPALLSLVVVLLPSLEGWSFPPCPGSYDKGTWNNCLGTYTWSPQNKYVGTWKDGKKHGQGTHTFPDGSMYVGTWKDGNKHGQGVYTLTDGRK